jgi:hypothetical protein
VRTLTIILACALSSCSPATSTGEDEGDQEIDLKVLLDLSTSEPPDSDQILAGPFFEKDAYSGSEVSDFLAFNAQFYHQIGSSSFVAFRVECLNRGSIELTDLALYTLPDSVSVRPWMGFRFADFGNWAYEVDPERTAASRVDARLLEVLPAEDLNVTPAPVRYRLRFSLLFADGTAVPSLETSELTCYPEGDFWPPPDIRLSS